MVHDTIQGSTIQYSTQTTVHYGIVQCGGLTIDTGHKLVQTGCYPRPNVTASPDRCALLISTGTVLHYSCVLLISSVTPLHYSKSEFVILQLHPTSESFISVPLSFYRSILIQLYPAPHCFSVVVRALSLL